MEQEQELTQKMDMIISLLQECVKCMSTSKSASNYTVDEWAYIWLYTYKKNVLRDLTFKKYESINRLYISKAIGKIQLIDLTAEMLQELLNGIEHERTREHVYAQLSQMIGKAVKQRIIDFNPMQCVEIQKHRKMQGNALTQAEERILIKELKTDSIGDYYLFCLWAGLRRGECLALTRGDIDFDKRQISITKSYNAGHMHGTKTDAGKRVVPLFDNLYEVAKKYAHMGDDERLFPCVEGTVYKHLARVLEKCNFDKRITVHTLRHTFITRCFERGIDVKTIAKWVGHTDTNLTLSTYTHINEDYEQKQIELYNI